MLTIPLPVLARLWSELTFCLATYILGHFLSSSTWLGPQKYWYIQSHQPSKGGGCHSVEGTECKFVDIGDNWTYLHCKWGGKWKFQNRVEMQRRGGTREEPKGRGSWVWWKCIRKLRLQSGHKGPFRVAMLNIGWRIFFWVVHYVISSEHPLTLWLSLRCLGIFVLVDSLWLKLAEERH